MGLLRFQFDEKRFPLRRLNDEFMYLAYLCLLEYRSVLVGYGGTVLGSKLE